MRKKLEKILFSQGFGSNRQCRDLIKAGLVKLNGVVHENPGEEFLLENLLFTIKGEDWRYQEKAYLVLNKPSGYECSHKPLHHQSIYNLIPRPLIQRNIQCVGRLDADTTGLILMSDDGQFIHTMTSPKKNIGKTYQITTSQEITEAQIQELLKGVVLHDDPKPCLAKDCFKTSPNTLTMTITEGRYHQVKRMMAAVGNQVTALHRSAIGAYCLPLDLSEGAWRWLSLEDLQ